jgi:hypothetical protein
MLEEELFYWYNNGLKVVTTLNRVISLMCY